MVETQKLVVDFCGCREKFLVCCADENENLGCSLPPSYALCLWCEGVTRIGCWEGVRSVAEVMSLDTDVTTVGGWWLIMILRKVRHV